MRMTKPEERQIIEYIVIYVRKGIQILMFARARLFALRSLLNVASDPKEN